MKMKLVVLGLVLGLFAFAPAANAATITFGGPNSFDVVWAYAPTNPDLSATATFTVTNWHSTYFDLTISDIQNTTPATPFINARLTAIGFGLTPSATGIAILSEGAVYSAAFGETFPAFPTVDICAYAGLNCAGGSNAGLLQGSALTDSVSIRVLGSFGDTLTFDPLAAKFQTDAGSFEVPGCEAGDSSCTPTQVPEPTSMLLLGTGLLGLGVIARRRK